MLTSTLISFSVECTRQLHQKIVFIEKVEIAFRYARWPDSESPNQSYPSNNQHHLSSDPELELCIRLASAWVRAPRRSSFILCALLFAERQSALQLHLRHRRDGLRWNVGAAQPNVDQRRRARHCYHRPWLLHPANGRPVRRQRRAQPAVSRPKTLSSLEAYSASHTLFSGVTPELC